MDNALIGAKYSCLMEDVYRQHFPKFDKNNKSKDLDDIKNYNKRKDKILKDFKNEILNELGLIKHPKADLLFNMAWEYGHGCSFSDVIICAEDFARLLEK